MIPSLTGLLVCLALAVVARLLGSVVLVGLPASLAFGATAFATLPALGGSSPQIYTLFAICLVATPFLQTGGLHTLAAGASRSPITLLLLVLMVHAAGAAIILPRLFAGETNVFVASSITGVVSETVLAPVSGNISQTAYFVLGAMVCLALSASLRDRSQLLLLRRGLMLWVLLNVSLGAIDLLAKKGGAGDVLEIIRTASYAMATYVEHGGFLRIAGGYSEASAFGAAIFTSMVFCVTLHRHSGNHTAGMLGLMSLALLLLSTSSAAYAAFAVYLSFLGMLAMRNLLLGRVRKADLALLYGMLAAFTLVLALALYSDNFLDPIRKLLDATVFSKSSSSSAAERGYWNARSLASVVDTGGMGIGMGSSRASNWFIAVLSQTGILGAALQLALVCTLLRPAPRPGSGDVEVTALHEAARATGMASLLPSLLAGGSADPGILFFLCVAVTLGCRRLLQSKHHPALREAQRPLQRSLWRTRGHRALRLA